MEGEVVAGTEKRFGVGDKVRGLLRLRLNIYNS
jgi:hypothetical protein